ncbi:MAG: recombinase family protein [Ruminococcus sp.]|nr:recombinase family protein [Ruminococcus sp.]
MKLKQQKPVTALYCRYSKDEDYHSGNSMSIRNQKAMLENYANEKGFSTTEFYVDDGFTGTNYERPAFKKLIADVENGTVGTIIVKDLSRLGREYLQTGYYTEIYFPQNDVRCIAINDGFDSDIGENEFAPFRNIINEWYAKDISKKIKSALRTKALKGDCVSGMPPYGYSKDEHDRTKLVPNDKAPYVQMMFQMALEGKSCWEIAGKLQELKLLIPRADNLVRNGNADSPTFPKYPYCWQKSTIKGILTNPVYTGKTVSHKREIKSFKDKRIIERPEEDWIVVENTHEPLVSESDFETVKARVSVKTRDKTTNPDNIFRGIVYCPDCGKRHGFSKRQCDKNSKGAYRCATMVKYGKEYCSNHYITFEQLYEVVLRDVQRHTALAEKDFDRYVDILNKTSDKSKSTEKSSLIRETEKANKRISELEILLQKLYEDKVFGVISEERFLLMSSSMENELSELKARVRQIADDVSESEKNSANAAAFAKLVEQYIGIEKLDYELVHMLIDRIYVYEREVIGGKSHVRIDICYRFIGNCSEDEPVTVVRRKS